MLNIFSHQGNTNENHNEITLHIHYDAFTKESQITTTGKDVEKLEPSNISYGNAK